MRSHARVVVSSILSAAALAACKAPAATPSAAPTTVDLSAYDMVDLTHAFDAQTIYWPTSPSRFAIDTLAYGPSEGGWFYSSFRVSTPEHGGTHLDAPMHFGEGKNSASDIPLERLITPAVVIDVSTQSAANRDYLLTTDDVLAWEKQHGQIPAGAAVLLRTGWSQYWPDTKAYLGDDTPGDATHLSFPSFGADAAKLLVQERRAGALGVDVASIDYGKSADFMVHRTVAEANAPGFENLTNLDRLPATGALLIALPMKIGGGSGGPLRAVALIPKTGE